MFKKKNKKKEGVNPNAGSVYNQDLIRHDTFGYVVEADQAPSANSTYNTDNNDTSVSYGGGDFGGGGASGSWDSSPSYDTSSSIDSSPSSSDF